MRFECQLDAIPGTIKELIDHLNMEKGFAPVGLG